MDSLALLCNLHADGPATLGQLRRAGCQSLADLQRLAPQELADLLQVPPAMARRLNREARLLADRVGEDPLDPEEAPENVAVPFVEADPSPARGSTQAAVERLRPIDREIVDQAMSRQPAFRSHPDQPKNGQAEPRNQPTWEWGDAKEIQPNVAQSDEMEAAPVVPPPALAPKPHPGAALIGAVDGLDRAVAGALAAAGVNTIEDLIDRDAGPLARQTGLNFSRVRRFQFLARRALLSEHEPAPAPKSEPLPPRAPQSPPAKAEATAASQPEPSVQEIVPAPAPMPKFTPRHDVATPFGAPLLPKELQTVADVPIHLPAKSETSAELPASIDLPDHPVAEFEPQSGGPMVAPQALDSPWRPEELGEEEAARGAAGEEDAESILHPTASQDEAPAVVEDEPHVETPVTPLGRWVPRALRGVEETPIECVEPEPVLVPPPPPRRFWEPKRFWEARKNRREKAALDARSETENLPDTEEAASPASSPVLPEVPRPTQIDRQPSVTPAAPTDGALPWDFSTPEGSAQYAAARAPRPRKESTLEAPRGKGFEFSDAEKETTREDASGPFA